MTDAMKKHASLALTVVGVLTSLTALLASPDMLAHLTALFGEAAAVKLASAGTLLSAFGRGLLDGKK